jgi:polyphosphate kinase 2 (PPK2 family)
MMIEDRFDRLREWMELEFEDTLDDLLEVEFNEPMLSEEVRKLYRQQHPDGLDGRVYYPNLLRLQAEMIKLQDWVVENNAKILIICEGRDSAGKGGVIKRITQRLNPRVARVVALPKAVRARDVTMVLPALCAASSGRRRDRAVRPVLVQPRRC